MNLEDRKKNKELIGEAMDNLTSINTTSVEIDSILNDAYALLDDAHAKILKLIKLEEGNE